MTNGMKDLFLSVGHAFLELPTRFFFSKVDGSFQRKQRQKTKKTKTKHLEVQKETQGNRNSAANY